VMATANICPTPLKMLPRQCPCAKAIPRGLRSLSLFRHKSRSPRFRRGGTPVETGARPPTAHPGGQASDTIIPNSGRRSSEEGGPNLENGACRPRAVTAAAPSVRSKAPFLLSLPLQDPRCANTREIGAMHGGGVVAVGMLPSEIDPPLRTRKVVIHL